MDCVKWYNKTILLIREEKWTELEQPGDCSCWNCETECCRIERMFIKEGKFCKKAQEAALYLNMNQKLNWVKGVVFFCNNIETLKAIVESGIIDVNSSLAGMLLSYNVSYWMEALEYLFEKGCSVDIQDDNGNSLLMNANLCWDSYENENPWWTNYEYEMTKFLLERGADPLLEDKEGYNLVSYAKECFSKEDQDRLFEMINLRVK